jgi:glycosyltransferase involved in cell wall biosynthesis
VFFDAYPHVVAGAQLATLMLMEGLRDRGWSVALAVPADGPFAAAARNAGFDATVLDFPDPLRVYGRRTSGRRAASAAVALPRVWMRAAAWLRSNADIVHVADHRGQLLMAPAAALARRPVVWQAHGILGGRALNVACTALASAVITPTQAAADRMPGIGWRRSVRVIPYAVAPRFLADASRTPASPPTIVAIGRLHPDKGFDVLLDAIARLRGRVDARAQIIGRAQEGWERYAAELHDRRHALGLDDVVDFPGYIEDPMPNLLAASVYVQPSRDRTESQGIALLEAMALGVPVVATRAGGVVETMGAGAFGPLVPPEDPDALASALAEVLTDPAAAAVRASGARAHVHAASVPDRMVDQVEEVYRSITRG